MFVHPCRSNSERADVQPSTRRWSIAGAVALLASAPVNAQSSFAVGTPLDWSGVLTGAFLGFLLLPVFYNVAFFVILRERFLVWQMARVLALVALTISLSSLPLGPWLTGTSFARAVLINVLFDCAVAITGPFLRSILEPGMVSRQVSRLLGWQPWLVALTTPAMLMNPCPPLYMALRNGLLVSILALICFALAQAIVRGSRTARFQAAAWSCLLAVCGVSMFHDIVLRRPFGMFLYALFGALALEMLLTSLGIGDRFMRLKREHDEARASAGLLEKIAQTDPLTGLPNRRAIEARFAAARPRAVAIVDIDHFKAINDAFGHACGDAVIVAVAAALDTGDAFAARIGGEEFALLLYSDQPWLELEWLRREMPGEVARSLPDLDRAITASAGISALGVNADFAEALKAADVNLYLAKASGRNRSQGLCPLTVTTTGPEAEAVAA